MEFPNAVKKESARSERAVIIRGKKDAVRISRAKSAARLKRDLARQVFSDDDRDDGRAVYASMEAISRDAEGFDAALSFVYPESSRAPRYRSPLLVAD